MEKYWTSFGSQFNIILHSQYESYKIKEKASKITMLCLTETSLEAMAMGRAKIKKAGLVILDHFGI
jgi:hypothetical protein